MVLCMFLVSAPVRGRAFQAFFNFTCVHMHAFTCVHGGVGGVGWGGNDVCVCDMIVHMALVLFFKNFSMRSHAITCMLSHAFMGGLGGG